MIVHKSHHFNDRNIIQHSPHQSTTFTPVPPLFPLLFFSANSFHGGLLFFSVSSETLIKKWSFCLFTSVRNSSFDGKMYLVSLLSQHPPSNFFSLLWGFTKESFWIYRGNKKFAIGREKLDSSWLKSSLKEMRNEISLLAFVADWNNVREFWDSGIIRRWILKLFSYRFRLKRNEFNK